MTNEEHMAYLKGITDGRQKILDQIKVKRDELAPNKKDDEGYWSWAALDQLIDELDA